MILNGINVFPSAIEDTLESDPDVKEAVAYAIKSRVHGEIPVAAVVLKPNAQDPGEPNCWIYAGRSRAFERRGKSLSSIESRATLLANL